jgi:eukaryotic-like serine/threonine-protein kinase
MTTHPPAGGTIDRWRRVEEICDAALPLDPSQRDAYLAGACGPDLALRREVEALLVHDTTSNHFLETPIGAVAANVMDPPRDLIGARIAEYVIDAKLGEGGMGEVYRAHDARLGRDVAIKVLPAAVANDRDRLKRFEREARLLAKINHPSIGAIYGLVEANGVRALVLELIEGDTLSAVLARGPLKLERAVSLAAQIADALDHAHRRGITHRDLKPSNIMLTRDGVKLLDFGVGKWTPATAEITGTRPSTLTGEGAIVGTLHYMSPEQLEGRATDARSDVFSFGAVLFEMLSGRKAFDGASQASIIAAVLEAPTPRLTRVTGALATRVDRVLNKCLAKDPDDRWQSAHDLADELRWLMAEAVPGGEAPRISGPATSRRGVTGAIAVAAALLILVVMGWTSTWRSSAVVTPASTLRFSVQTQAGDLQDGSFDISDDGEQLVYYDETAAGRVLHVRRLDRFDTFALRGSDNAFSPVFSPDGQWVAYARGGVVRKIPVSADASPVVLLEATPALQITWPTADTILLSGRDQPIRRVSANGGLAEPVTSLQPGTDVDHHGPELLPSGTALLFAAHGKRNRFAIAVQDLRTGARKTLIESGFAPVYSPTGHLLFGRGSAIMAVAFDEERLEVRGDPVVVVEGVSGDPLSGHLNFRLSGNGRLVYLPERATADRLLTWVDRSGRQAPLDIGPRSFENPRVSPDGKQAAFVVRDGGRRDIWVHDIGSGRLARLTENGDNFSPRWLPDGSGLVYSRDDGLASLVVRQRFSGAALDTLGSSTEDELWPSAIDRDGRVLVTVWPPTSRSYIAQLIAGSHAPQVLLKTPGEPRFGRLSPDGRWLAYAESVSGRPQVFIQGYPEAGLRRQISVGGGLRPEWRRDGKELFFRYRNQMFGVPIETASGLQWGRPQLLFEFDPLSLTLTTGDFDVAPDGRFLVIKPAAAEVEVRPLHVIVNWHNELRSKVPTGE